MTESFLVTNLLTDSLNLLNISLDSLDQSLNLPYKLGLDHHKCQQIHLNGNCAMSQATIVIAAKIGVP